MMEFDKSTEILEVLRSIILEEGFSFPDSVKMSQKEKVFLGRLLILMAGQEDFPDISFTSIVEYFMNLGASKSVTATYLQRLKSKGIIARKDVGVWALDPKAAVLILEAAGKEAEDIETVIPPGIAILKREKPAMKDAEYMLFEMIEGLRNDKNEALVSELFVEQARADLGVELEGFWKIFHQLEARKILRRTDRDGDMLVVKILKRPRPRCL